MGSEIQWVCNAYKTDREGRYYDPLLGLFECRNGIEDKPKTTTELTTVAKLEKEGKIGIYRIANDPNFKIMPFPCPRFRSRVARLSFH